MNELILKYFDEDTLHNINMYIETYLKNGSIIDLQDKKKFESLLYLADTLKKLQNNKEFNILINYLKDLIIKYLHKFSKNEEQDFNKIKTAKSLILFLNFLEQSKIIYEITEQLFLNIEKSDYVDIEI